MLSKLTALLQTKAGAAALAALLVTGSGTAAAITVTHGDLSKLGATIQTALHGNDQGENEGFESDCNSNGQEATEAPEATHAVEATERPEATHAAEATERPDATRTSSGGSRETEPTHVATHASSSEGDEHGTACIAGTVTRTGTSSFVVTTTTGPVTVNVSTGTKFVGGVKGVGDLQIGDAVRVTGNKQSDGSFTAITVNSQGATQDGGDGASSEGTKTP
jgi:hypothetical protein